MLGNEEELGADVLELSSLAKRINKENDMRVWMESHAYNTIFAVL